jgi:hypothetical protein
VSPLKLALSMLQRFQSKVSKLCALLLVLHSQQHLGARCVVAHILVIHKVFRRSPSHPTMTRLGNWQWIYLSIKGRAWYEVDWMWAWPVYVVARFLQHPLHDPWSWATQIHNPF